MLTPGPTILVKAVAGITAEVFEKGQNSEMAFRMSLFRSLLQVDSKPTMDTVMQFHNHRLGKMEQLASLWSWLQVQVHRPSEALQRDESKSWTKYLLTFRKDGSPASM